MKRNEATNTQSGTFSRECVSRLKNSTLFSQWVFCPGFYVNSFSGSCPKTISRARKVSPTGSTTLLRLQLCLTIDCTHRSRHSVFYFLERKLPAQVSWKTTLQPLALRTRFDYLKMRFKVPGKCSWLAEGRWHMLLKAIWDRVWRDGSVLVLFSWRDYYRTRETYL